VRILVTGGAGFLGSHLSEKLLSLGHSVLCIDNFYTGNRRNILHLFDHPDFEFIRHDVTFPLYVEVDGIFNLACPASPLHYQKNPVQTFKTNVHGVINMLGLAKRTGARFFQASTSEIYGDPTVSPQSEEYWGNVNPIGIRSCYDEGKRAAETLTLDYYRQFGIDVRVARIFNTFGPRMDLNDGRVISNFIVQALRNQPLTIYGKGNQTRSFCFVDDLIDAFCKFFFSSTESRIMNLGNPKPVDVLSLAREIIELTESKSPITFEPLPNDDPQQREPNIERAQRELDWNPKVSRKEGLIKTIKYFREVISKMDVAN
jgi:UDP-glucuronate decarboxylase